MREDIAPGAFVLVDQFIDRTYARATSFFGAGCIAHVSMAEPVSPYLRPIIAAAAAAERIEFQDGGTCLIIEGPQFSSLAESRLYRSWGADLIGMTGMPEAKLAREAELPYAAIAMVTDFDCWHPDYRHVDAAAVLQVMRANGSRARDLVRRIAREFPGNAGPCPIGSDRALDGAIVTPPRFRDPRLMKKLSAITRRVLAAEPPPVTPGRP